MSIEAARAVRTALDEAREGLVEREVLLELVALGAVAREHLLVIGPPGTAKSEAARRAARAFDASCFEYLLGRFTEPSEIFGPVDLRRLREGVVERRPECCRRPRSPSSTRSSSARRRSSTRCSRS